MRLLPLLLLAAILAFPHIADAGSSENLSGWAWSSTIGWVSLNSTTGGGANHGVNVSSSGLMSGYAWSPNVGWISFNSSNLSGCPSGTCTANFNSQTGAVTGWARAIAGNGSSVQTGNWGGWIQLSGPSYGVSASGCQWSGYAWGGGPSLDTGVIGWLSFSGPGYGVTGTGAACAGGTTNLTAGSITPVTAQPGVSTAYTGTVTNVGQGATGGPFSVLFQRATDGGGTSVTDLGTATVDALASGCAAPASLNATLSTGTWYIRICADKTSSANTGVITESNENDNCGVWTAVTVAAATPPSVSCTVSATSISPGQSVTYSANPVGGASSPYTWVASDGASVGTGATASRTLNTPGVYAMNVRASGTAVSYCPNVSVTANWCTTGSPDLTITATPARLREGQSTALTWSATGVNGQSATCTVSGPGVSWSSAVSAAPVCSASGSANPTISTQSTYTLTCGGVSESVTVNVIPNFTEF